MVNVTRASNRAVQRSEDDRPMFNKTINELQLKCTIVVTKLDRFCRTTKEGLIYVERPRKKSFVYIF